MRAEAHRTKDPVREPGAGQRLEHGSTEALTIAEAKQWDHLKALALRHLNRFIALEPKVLRGDDPEAIHDIRVASRRLQQALDFLFPAPPHGVRRLRRRIKRCRAVLSDVRNCDVFLERVSQQLARKRTSSRATWEAIRDYLESRRADEFARALRKLTKLNLASVYLALKEHLTPLSSGTDSRGPVPVKLDELPPLAVRVREALEPVWQKFEARLVESQQQPEGQTMHRARIAAKKLRYLVELIAELDVPGGREHLAWLRRLQTELGKWHDLEVMDQMLAEMIAKPGFLRQHPDVAAGVMRIISSHRGAKKRYQTRYLALTSAEGYARLKAWATYLLEPSPGFPAP
jgi:CHAD domain-containing protein